MYEIKRLTKADASETAQIISSAYEKAPWNEEYNPEKLKGYCLDFISSDTRPCFALYVDKKMTGIALCIQIPDLDGSYLRVEKFCIVSEKQKQGLGTIFLDLIKKQAERLGFNSILLGTQKDFPVDSFYRKNHFHEVPGNILLYYDIINEKIINEII